MKLLFGPHCSRKGYMVYHSTWVRTKKQLKNTDVEMYRILMEDYTITYVKSLQHTLGDKGMIYWQNGYGPTAFGKGVANMGIQHPMFGSDIVHLSPRELRTINPGKIKNQQYTYHLKDHDPQALHDLLKAWADSNPLVHVGNMQHQAMKLLKKQGLYKWTYEFDGVRY